ncbi:MAG: hypothetical protein R3C11_13965 [Planctomycetaceae bacterium]
MFAGQNQWVLGHYQGNWGNRLAQVDLDDSGRKINANQLYGVKIHVDVDQVTMFVDGLPIPGGQL